jgi:protein phosphatase
MLLTFRDAYTEASRERGLPGVLRLCCDCFVDFVKTVGMEHARSWRQRRADVLTGYALAQIALALPFTLDVAECTDIGLARTDNEDSLVALVPDDGHLLRARGALFVVADGMGGCGHGRVASGLAVQQVRDCYYHELQGDIPTALQSAVHQASDAIRLASQTKGFERDGAQDIGTTCVAAVLHEWSLYIANVGDSRAYVLRDGRLRQVTRDHSLVAQLIERGELTHAEARTHPQRSLIYRALGFPDTEVDLFVEPVQDGDIIVLCTDGLCSVVEDEELGAIALGYPPSESVQRLIARANAYGGPDNVSVVVVRVADRVGSRTDPSSTVG